MKRMRTVAFLLSFALLAGAPSHAAETKDTAKTPEERLEQAATHLRDWFDSLLGHIDDIVAKEDRRRLADKLQTLEGALYRFEWDKRQLIESITAPDFNDGRIADSASRLEASLGEVRAVLTDNGLPLRKAWKDKGDEVELELEDALGVRKGWINGLRGSLQRHEPVDRDAVAKKGEAALKQLREANVALTKLISRLRE
jgi:hypothetical protein